MEILVTKTNHVSLLFKMATKFMQTSSIYFIAMFYLVYSSRFTQHSDAFTKIVISSMVGLFVIQ